MKEAVLKIANKKRKLYLEHRDEMIADFNRENETAEGYNGRQILELIQNCDDEGSHAVHIIHDEANQTLSICNYGEPFSKEGYRSLSISNLSAKTSKKKYIGNKGLGFRSIINWSKGIEIISNGISILFSEEVKRKTYEELFSEEIRIRISEENNFNEGVIPIPLLAIPEITDKVTPHGYTTIIVIEYKEEYLDEIVKQLKLIAPETLLFLNSLKEITFAGFDEINDIVATSKKLENNKEFGPFEEIVINNKTLTIFKDSGEIKDSEKSIKKEQDFYEIKLAITDKLTKEKNPLYSYFPTNTTLYFPYIIHGNFDLDQTRNHLNLTKKNRIIIGHLVELIVRVAVFISKKEINWLPLKLLNFSRPETIVRLRELGFYENLENAMSNLDVFPCLDGTYKKKQEVVYFNSKFSKFIETYGFNRYYPNMLIQEDESLYLSPFEIKNEFEGEIEVLNELSETITDIKIRAEFIELVSTTYGEVEADLLLNADGELIKSENLIYTPPKSNIKIPSFCNIDVINRDLYDELIKRFKLDNLTNKSRELVIKLKKFVSIQPYEPLPLAQKIISITKKKIKEEPSVKYVLEMVSVLFQNYLLGDELGELQIQKIPLVNKKGEIELSNKLFLSEKYASGWFTERLFSKVYPHKYFLAPPEMFNIEGDEDKIEDFFIWLGVNSFSRKIEKKLESKSNNLTPEALNFIVKKEVGFDSSLSENLIKIDFESIFKLEEILSELDAEEVLCWILYDKILKEILLEDDERDEIKIYNKDNSLENTIYINYIQEIFKYHKLYFKDFLIGARFSWMNHISIDYNHPIFNSISATKRDIDNLLVELGAKDEFVDLSIERVTQIINLIPKKFPDGKNSQTIYKMATDHYNKNELDLTAEVQVFANKTNKLTLLDPSDVFFSDKVRIPKQLQNDFPILNFPSRAGGQRAIDFFEVNDLAEIDIELESFEVNHNHTQKFEKYFHSIKPFLFVYRLNRLDKEGLKLKESQILNDIKILLCNDLEYRVNNKLYRADNYEFIVGEKNHYYIKIEGLEDIRRLRKNSDFADSFSEIICQIFDTTSDKSEYRNILREDEEEDIIHLIKNEQGDEIFAEAIDYIGTKNFEFLFWKTIFISKYSTVTITENDIKKIERLQEHFKHLKINYKFLNDIGNFHALREIFQNLSIDIGDYNRNTVYEISLEAYHRKKFENLFLSKKELVKSSIWIFLNGGSVNRQKKFLKLVNKIEERESFINKVAQIKKFDLDYDSIFNQFFSTRFKDIKLSDKILNLDSYRQENLVNFNEKELLLIDDDIELRSLSYFETGIPEIQKILEGKKRDLIKQQTNTPTSTPTKITELSSSKYSTKRNEVQGSSKSVYVPKNFDSSANKSIGNNSEQIVFNYLIEKYGQDNVSWESKMNEGLHYDIRYSANNGQSWKYVEVKTFANDKFIYTHSEKEFGEKHKSEYEIWLVNLENEIQVLKDFFESNYVLNPKDYVVYLDFNE